MKKFLVSLFLCFHIQLFSEYCDLHLHLNGSFSHEFLRETALKHRKEKIFEQFEAIQKKHLEFSQRIQNQQETIKLIWKKFSLIHEIISELSDINEGTISVRDSFLYSSTAILLQIEI